MDIKTYTDDSPKSPPGYSALKDRDPDETSSLDSESLTMLRGTPKPTHQQPTQRNRKLRSCARTTSALLILALLILTFALTFHAVETLGKLGALINAKVTPPPAHRRSYKHPCGRSAPEARAAGCVFDVMSMQWQSPECYDAELAESFALEGPWAFFYDEAGQRPLESMDVLSDEPGVYWASRRYFVVHCVYGWKAMHRAWARGWRMDSNLASEFHTELCARVLSNTSIPLEAITTEVHVEFPSCN